MIIAELSFQQGETNEWLVRSWDSASPTGVTEVTYPHIDAAQAAIKALFSADTEIDAILLARGEQAVLVTNAATITTAKNALRTAEGL